jgi:PAS domain-containing protein
VFAGGFTLDAASTVCDPEATAPLETLDYVDGLVRRSLFIVDDAEPATRYRMLETIRQYAAERLEMSDDPVAIGRAHLDWAVAFTRDAADGLRGPDDAAWIARMEHELGNIRVALQFAASIHDLDSATTLLASAPIGALWDNRLGTSMAAMAKELAPEIGEPDHPVTAALLSLLALDAALRYSGEEAVALATRAREVAQRHDDWLRTGPWLAWLLSSLIAHDDQTLQVAASEALNRAIAENDTFAVAEWHAALGIAHWMRGDVDEAQRLTDTALALAEENRADNLVMRNAFLRGVSLLVPGSDPAAAMPYFQRAVRLGERVGGNVLFGGAAWAMLLSDGGDRTMSAASLARQLAEHLATPMFLIDADGMMVFFNDATAAILGTTFAEVGEIPSAEFGRNLDLGTTDGQPLRRRDTPAGVAFFQQRPIHQTLRATGYDGRRNTYDATAHPLFGAAGEMEGVVCVFWEHGHVSEAR